MNVLHAYFIGLFSAVPIYCFYRTFEVLWRATRKPSAEKPVLESSEKRKHGYILRFSDGSAYRGNCTVWHTYPDGRRCGTMTESWLADEWEKIRSEGEDES
jgi:hypothetical protein